MPLLRSTLLVVPALALLAVTGCSAPSGGQAAATTRPATTTPSPSASAPGASDSDLVIGTGGIVTADGDRVVEIGAPVAEPNEAVTWHDCEFGDGTGGWWSTARDADGGTIIQGGTVGGARSGAVTAILASLPIRTAEGIGVGSTLAELRSAYGSRLTAGEHGDLSESYQVSDASGTLIFEVASAADAFDVPVGAVAVVTAATAGTPASLTAGTDISPGGCA